MHMHLVVTCGHFWSRDRAGGRTIGSAIIPLFVALCFIEPELLPIDHCGNMDVRPLFDAVTLTLTL